MAYIGGLPNNKNQLSPLNFQFRIKKLPATNFFVTAVELPGLTASPPKVGNPLHPLPMAYDKLQYNDLTLTFKVDEDLVNYLEIYDWMVGVGFPTRFEERKMLDKKGVEGKFADGSLTVGTSKKNPNVQFMFKDLLPYSLSNLRVGTTDSDVIYVEATVSFVYSYYTVERRKA